MLDTRVSSIREFQLQMGTSSVGLGIERWVSEFLTIHSHLAPPFHLPTLAKTQRIVRIVERVLEIDARLVPEEDHFFVEVKKDVAPKYDCGLSSRQRFSVAHEIGHTVLMGHSKTATHGFTDRTGQSNEEEAEESFCDALASELLMPKCLFARDAWKMGPTLRTSLVLAGKYGVSLTASMIRLIKLQLARSALIKWRPQSLRNAGGPYVIDKVVFGRNLFREDDLLFWNTPGGESVRKAAESGEIEKGVENFTLGGTQSRLYSESLRVGTRESGKVISLVFFEAHSEILFGGPPKAPSDEASDQRTLSFLG